MWTTYWWAIEDENSDLCGEEFFTELRDASKDEHYNLLLIIDCNLSKFTKKF